MTRPTKPRKVGNQVWKTIHREIQKTTGAFVSPPFSRGLAPALLLTSMMMSAPICRSQDTAPAADANQQKRSADQHPKREGSSAQPPGQERMFGIVPTYGLVEAGMQPPPLT